MTLENVTAKRKRCHVGSYIHNAAKIIMITRMRTTVIDSYKIGALEQSSRLPRFCRRRLLLCCRLWFRQLCCSAFFSLLKVSRLVLRICARFAKFSQPCMHLMSILFTAVSSQECYKQPGCIGTTVQLQTQSARGCCAGTQDGMSYGTQGNCIITQCIGK